MSNKYASLPPKILTKIMSNVYPAQQLGECRLVCHSWNEPAWDIMLDQDIRLSSQEDILDFCELLERNPSKKKLIKRLHLVDILALPFDGWGLEMSLMHFPKVQYLTVDIKDEDNAFDLPPMNEWSESFFDKTFDRIEREGRELANGLSGRLLGKYRHIQTLELNVEMGQLVILCMRFQRADD